MDAPDRGVVELHVVSDSTGETAARLALALEAQFPEQGFVIVRHPRAESGVDLLLAVERMKGRSAVAIYTLVEPTLRALMRTLCRRARLHYCDVLSQPLAAIAKVSGRSAKMMPQARPPLDENYFRRVAAIEFAVKNDDGLGRGLGAAEVVLVGVSRTSKTPLSIYLGYLGWRATNLPLVKGIEPPKQLFEIDAARIVGLTIDAGRLAEIRSERLQLMGGDRSYANLNAIYEDLEHAAAIHRRLGCPVFDVSEHSIEEVALRIVRAVERRTGGRDPARG
jgi:regulator of PEP synthase PpsR (kinase-PPPase family)